MQKDIDTGKEIKATVFFKSNLMQNVKQQKPNQKSNQNKNSGHNLNLRGWKAISLGHVS